MADFNQQSFRVLKIFLGNYDAIDDGVVIAENCLIHIDQFNVLCILSSNKASNNQWKHPALFFRNNYFPLNDAESISFRRIRSAGGTYSMGRIVIKGRFNLVPEKVTIKMELAEYSALIESSRSWV